MAPIGQRTSYAILPKTRKTTNAATGTVAPSRIAVADRPLLRFLIEILHPAMREEIRLVVDLFPAISAKHDQTLSGGTDGSRTIPKTAITISVRKKVAKKNAQTPKKANIPFRQRRADRGRFCCQRIIRQNPISGRKKLKKLHQGESGSFAIVCSLSSRISPQEGQIYAVSDTSLPQFLQNIRRLPARFRE